MSGVHWLGLGKIKEDFGGRVIWTEYWRVGRSCTERNKWMALQVKQKCRGRDAWPVQTLWGDLLSFSGAHGWDRCHPSWLWVTLIERTTQSLMLELGHFPCNGRLVTCLYLMLRKADRFQEGAGEIMRVTDPLGTMPCGSAREPGFYWPLYNLCTLSSYSSLHIRHI